MQVDLFDDAVAVAVAAGHAAVLALQREVRPVMVLRRPALALGAQPGSRLRHQDQGRRQRQDQ